MTTHVHFDLVGGIAGDMTLGALVDAGVDAEQLVETLRRSGLPMTEVTARREWRGGLAGTTVAVAPEASPPARSWADVRELVDGATLSEGARARALDVFERLAVAEAAVHGCAPDDVHFHEVGAMDSIVDIVGTAVALELLGAASFSCGAVPVCEGRVETAHGALPLPAPATAQLLRGFELCPIPGAVETVTPTGAAILASLCGGSTRAMPPLRLTGSGCGLGTAELPDRANVLRVLVGELVATTATAEARLRGDAVVIEASIDDMDPRLFGQAASALFDAGALDVAMVPLQMKKQRPGTLLQVIARPELEGVLTGILLRETTTLGVRSHDVRRTELERRHEIVATRFGTVRVKLGLLGEERLNASPEYEDCVARAREHGVPVKEVLASAVAAAARHEDVRDRGEGTWVTP